MDLAANLERVRQRINAACVGSGRDPSAVILLAVTKGQPPQVVRAAAELGLNLFGENRVQEAKLKIGQCPTPLRWHLIGHLQSNKCRDAVHFFQMIQSVDSLPLAEEINKCAEKSAKTMPVLLEINVAGESTKFGFRPEDLLAQLERINALRKIEIHGLMTIAPYTPEPEKARPSFRRLRELKEASERVLGAPLAHLSMGMTGDFEIAIEEGATMIRIGSALFGPRVRSEIR
ncbi:MAG: YggS family pyridoxal phosphate-dependent enzyme [Verrucomicrobiota bacterium]